MLIKIVVVLMDLDAAPFYASSLGGCKSQAEGLSDLTTIEASSLQASLSMVGLSLHG